MHFVPKGTPYLSTMMSSHWLLMAPPRSSSWPLLMLLLMALPDLSQVISFDPKDGTLAAGPSLLLREAMDFLATQGRTLDCEYLPFYSELTLAGMLLTGKRHRN